MKEERIESMKNIFARLFMVARKWEKIGDREYHQDDLTIKQVMTLIVAGNAFDYDPTLMEVAQALGTSHQNVKVMVSTLQKKGFLQVYTDEEDRRKSRVKINREKEKYWNDRHDRDVQLLEEIFAGVSDEELLLFRSIMERSDSTSNQILSK